MLKKLFVLFLLLTALPAEKAAAQAPFIRRISLPYECILTDMIAAGNGDLIAAGYKQEPYYDTIMGRSYFKLRYIACLVRLGPERDTLWSKTFPALGDRSMLTSIAFLSEGRYLVLGRKTADQPVLCCFDDKGNLCWQKDLPCYKANRLLRISANEYLVAGEEKGRHTGNYPKMSFIRTDSSGTVLQQRLYGPPDNSPWNCAYDVAVSSKGYLLAGGLAAKAQTQFSVLLLDGKGDSVTTRFYSDDRGRARIIRRLPDDQFIVAGGYSSSNTDLKNAFMVKLDANGDTLWTRRFGNGEGDDVNELLVLPSGELLVVTETNNTDIGIYRFSTQGQLLSEKILARPGNQIPHRLLVSGKYTWLLFHETAAEAGGKSCYLLRLNNNGSW